MGEVVRCPECNKQLRINDELLGRRVRCPSCTCIFPAQAISANDEPTGRDSESEDDSEIDHRRRRQGRRERRRASAVSKATFPAIALMLVGLIEFVLSIAMLAYQVTNWGEPPDPEIQGNPAIIGVRYGVVALSFLASCLIIAAGFCLKSLRWRGLAIAGSIFALLPCNLGCLVALPVGIWSLVVLNNSDIKDAFD